MSEDFEVYDRRVKAAEAAAEATPLANVRERELRSAKAWRQLADRQLMFETERARLKARRAEPSTAERLEQS